MKGGSSLLAVLVLLLLSLSLSSAQPEMPSGPPGSDSDSVFLTSLDGFEAYAVDDDFAVMGGKGTSYGLGYGGGGKGAFPVGAFGANVGLPAVPAVPLAIAYGGKGKGHGHGGKGKHGGGTRLGFLIAAPVPVAQPYGGSLSAERSALSHSRAPPLSFAHRRRLCALWWLLQCPFRFP